MAQNYKHEGCELKVVISATVEAGDAVNIGSSLSGVALGGGVSGDTIVVAIEGVFELPKATSLAIAQGDEVYLHVADGKITKTATDKPIGIAAAAAGSSDTTVEVLIDPKRGTNPSLPDVPASFADLAAVKTYLDSLVGAMGGQ